MSRSALVVAHPDDECLWGAAAVLMMPGEWTIVCCSIPRIDPVRAWKFFDACEALGATGRLIPLTESEPDIDLRGLELLDLNAFETIVTHGAAGEYGHHHHKQVHAYVSQRWPDKRMKFFAQPGETGSKQIKLSDRDREKKLEALRKYDHCLVYEWRRIPKWQALIQKYGEETIDVEWYRDRI